MKCRKCGNNLSWLEGLLDNDSNRCLELGRYQCKPCGYSLKREESRLVKQGRKMSAEMDGLKALDNKITSLHSMVQLGILRERQESKVL